MRRLLGVALVMGGLTALLAGDALAKGPGNDGSWVRQQLQLQLQTCDPQCDPPCEPQCDPPCDQTRTRQCNEDADQGGDRTRDGIRECPRPRLGQDEDEEVEFLLWLLGA